jgi:hypothetical protein
MPNTQVQTSSEVMALSALVQRAVAALASAKTAAEVLDARDMASVAYDQAKSTARWVKAKKAHDDLLGAVYRAQADALEIEAGAKRRLADEYDSAQARGEVRGYGGDRRIKLPQQKLAPTVAEIGLTYAQIYKARAIRDAETIDPGIVRRTLDDALAAGEEPTKGKVKRAVEGAIKNSKSSAENKDAPTKLSPRPSQMPPRERCLMRVRAMVLDEWLPQVPQQEWNQLISDLREEVNYMEQMIEKRKII